MSEATRRVRLLFICTSESTFVRTDLELLPERFDVQKYSGQGKDLGRPVELVRFLFGQLLWLVRNVRRADIIYGWFADYHMVLPLLFGRLFRKPVVVVLAGFDSNFLPEINYGVYASTWRAPAARFVLRNASLLLPLTRTLIYSTNTYTTWPEAREHGVRVHSGPDHAPFVAIPTGYDPDRWPIGPDERTRDVLTVAFIDSARTAYVKGLDIFASAARMLPDVSFTIVGVDPALRTSLGKEFDLPANVSILPSATPIELVGLYGAASVYAQLSRTEGVPSVLCEAMLCGCVPVGSRIFGIEEIIGDAGYLVDSPEPHAVSTAIREALDAPAAARIAARERIVSHYHLALRRRRLFEALDRIHESTAR